MCDHYLAPLSSANAALEAMKEIQEEAFKLGIPLRTRREGPNQFEFAPMFGAVQTQVDQNIVLMQVINEVAASTALPPSSRSPSTVLMAPVSTTTGQSVLPTESTCST